MIDAEGRESLPVSLVSHLAFCPRRLWLEAVGEKTPSLAVEHGIAAHEAVDDRRDDRSMRRRSVEAASAALGIHGRCDLVELSAAGAVKIVEYKSAPLRRSMEVTQQQRLQLALQSLLLADAGYRVDEYAVYFTTSRRTVPVEISPAELAEARDSVERARAIVESSQAPPPLDSDPRCDRCSHAGVCLPEERAGMRVRRVHATDPDGEVLHLSTPGSRARLSRGRVEVVKGDEMLGSVPLDRVQGLVVHGNVDLSSALVRELLWRRVSVVWASGRGRVVGYARSADSPNGGSRRRQFAASEERRLELARELVAAKIANQATMLRRASASRGDAADHVAAMRLLGRRATTASSVSELLGWEGAASARYFTRWPTMLAKQADPELAARWTGRVGRGAVDPLNVSLNVVYALLLGEVTRSVLACGLDPHAGFVHSSSRNKPALALDLMEQFRPVVADSVVLSAVNNGELKSTMFSTALGDWRISDDGRKVLIRGFERRMEQSFRHPTFGYLVTWRRAMEVQARMLLGVLDGTQERYVGIRVR